MSERKIVDYITAYSPADYPNEFHEEVKDLIKEGWQPFGTPFISHSDGVEFYELGMVKYES